MRYSSSSKKAATVVKGTVPPLASTPPVVLSERSLLLLAVVRLFVSFLWFQQLAWKMPLGFGGLRRYVISEAQHTFVPGYSLLWRARREHVNPLVLLDAGVLFAAVGQIFGRIVKANLLLTHFDNLKWTHPFGRARRNLFFSL